MKMSLQLHVPMFFLLSGFCLALGYGRRPDCTSYTWKLTAKDVPERAFDATGFLLGRLARIIPIYYTTFAMDLVNNLLLEVVKKAAFIIDMSRQTCFHFYFSPRNGHWATIWE